MIENTRKSFELTYYQTHKDPHRIHIQTISVRRSYRFFWLYCSRWKCFVSWTFYMDTVKQRANICISLKWNGIIWKKININECSNGKIKWKNMNFDFLLSYRDTFIWELIKPHGCSTCWVNSQQRLIDSQCRGDRILSKLPHLIAAKFQRNLMKKLAFFWINNNF